MQFNVTSTFFSIPGPVCTDERVFHRIVKSISFF